LVSGGREAVTAALSSGLRTPQQDVGGRPAPVMMWWRVRRRPRSFWASP